MIPKRNCYLLCKNVTFSCIFLLIVICLFLFTSQYLSSRTDLPKVNEYPVEINENDHALEVRDNKEWVGVKNASENIFKKWSVHDRVHVFYYPWYGNPSEDSEYLHWNHEYLPNWDKQDPHVYPTGRHNPPNDIGANFYPLLGCYSSKDSKTVDQHMKWIKGAGIGVLVISWYPPELSDKEGKPFDKLFPLFLDLANKYNLKVSFHIEPYEGRTPESFKENVAYIINKYGNHSALYKYSKFPSRKPLPVIYVYDSYLNAPNSWSSVLRINGEHTIRNTAIDAIVLGLIVELRHKQDIVVGGFDGFYTYFAANDFSYGSSWKNWKSLSAFARKYGLLFVPSVGPGYLDTRVRPWNGKTTRERKNGKYYKIAWNSALHTMPPLISITSFNEWHEGTQIEPAIPKSDEGYVYKDYLPSAPDFYLNLTRQFVSQYAEILSGS